MLGLGVPDLHLPHPVQQPLHCSAFTVVVPRGTLLALRLRLRHRLARVTPVRPQKSTRAFQAAVTISSGGRPQAQQRTTDERAVEQKRVSLRRGGEVAVGPLREAKGMRGGGGRLRIICRRGRRRRRLRPRRRRRRQGRRPIRRLEHSRHEAVRQGQPLDRFLLPRDGGRCPNAPNLTDVRNAPGLTKRILRRRRGPPPSAELHSPGLRRRCRQRSRAPAISSSSSAPRGDASRVDEQVLLIRRRRKGVLRRIARGLVGCRPPPPRLPQIIVDPNLRRRFLTSPSSRQAANQALRQRQARAVAPPRNDRIVVAQGDVRVSGSLAHGREGRRSGGGEGDSKFAAGAAASGRSSLVRFEGLGEGFRVGAKEPTLIDAAAAAFL
mmetsp:Transcript_8263/g.24846  ORF Transcript_8263/g.24846 Transcript_8263/m.24846 type:complete len:381 (-) Transcript_8263:89-1231(-)